MKGIIKFSAACLGEAARGGRLYWSWLLGLAAVVTVAVMTYGEQLGRGLIVTGMSDQVSWGVYIANFTFLVGVAAAAVMLAIPAYIFHRDDIKHVVLIGEGIAVAAVLMCLMFVIADLGRPDRLWHMIPLLGRFNFPSSMLAWDVVALNGYLALNLLIPAYILYVRYTGGEPNFRLYFPAVLVAMAWAISIHTVTAFLFSSNVGRVFWHTAVLGPRFLASAFSSGPALILLALQIIERNTVFRFSGKVVDLLALVVTVALQINIFLLGVELFTDFYFRTEHAAAATFLYFGLDGYNALVPWIWTAIGLNLLAVSILSVHALRRRRMLMNTALVLTVIGVWIEKGMGLIIPGFVPTPIGEVFPYQPTWNEIIVSLGIWAMGTMVFTVLAKVAIAIETGKLRLPAARGAGEQGAVGAE